MTKADQTRLMTWRFKVLQCADEGPRRVTYTCRHFGISSGLPGPPRGRSSARSSTSARRTTSAPEKIADYLRRLHGVSLAVSTVHRLLGHHGMGRLPANQKYRPHAALSVHGHRRLHADPSPQGLRRLQPAHRHPLRRRSPTAVTLPHARDSDRQWRRVADPLPCPRGRPGHRTRLYPPAHATSQRQGRAVAPNR